MPEVDTKNYYVSSEWQNKCFLHYEMHLIPPKLRAPGNIQQITEYAWSIIISILVDSKRHN